MDISDGIDVVPHDELVPNPNLRKETYFVALYHLVLRQSILVINELRQYAVGMLTLLSLHSALKTCLMFVFLRL